LMQDAKLGSEPSWHAPARKLLQGNQAIGVAERSQRGRRVALEVLVDVGTGERHDQRPVRKQLTKAADALGAAPGMQSDHQLGGGSIVLVENAHLVAEFAQDARPAQCRGAISRP